MPVEKFRGRALGYEKNGELSKAVFTWKVIQSLAPADAQAGEKIYALESKARAGAERHFVKGIEYEKGNTPSLAQKEFLAALAYDQRHFAALDHLKKGGAEKEYLTYETKEGDTLMSIARKVYQDPEKAFIVAYFSDLRGSGALKTGMTLKLPLLEPVVKARRATPTPPVTKVYDRTAAEKHYSTGIGYFLAEEFPQAIKEWEETLRLDPEHPNARKDIEKARNLLKKGRLP